MIGVLPPRFLIATGARMHRCSLPAVAVRHAPRLLAFGVMTALLPTATHAATYQVGPGRPHATLDSLFAAIDLEPGDVVEVDGGVTYPGGVIVAAADGGAPGNPVILRGMRAGGLRPLLRGGVNTIEIRANHLLLEGFEVTGTTTPTTTFRCVFHHSHDVTIRDAWIHDCPQHGVLGADQGSGSLTIEYSEISHAGNGLTQHVIYMATDEVAYPGAVFRLQHSWVHSANGGNLVKSRAERNEIYYNWLEGAFYHELELIGPDPAGAAPAWSAALAREDSDVVGNVIVHTAGFSAVLRLGGDGTGESDGRYRFVNNTIMRRNANNDTPTIFRLFHGIESVEMHNNIIFRDGPASVRLIREVEADWSTGVSRITGSANAFEPGATFVPPGWQQNLVVADPGFVDRAALDLRLVDASPLRDLGSSITSTPPAFDIHQPESPARFHPSRALQSAGSAAPRVLSGAAVDPGAFEIEEQQRIFGDGFEAR
jgi:hypothetical protein